MSDRRHALPVSKRGRVIGAVAGVGAAAIITMSGVAFASWRVTGTTTASASAANPTLAVTGGQVDGLYPGGARPALLDVRNVNDFPVRFDGFSFADVRVDPGHASTCPPGVIRVGMFSGGGTTMLPGEMRSFEVPVEMDSSAPQGCAGATFDIDWVAEASVGSL